MAQLELIGFAMSDLLCEACGFRTVFDASRPSKATHDHPDYKVVRRPIPLLMWVLS